MINVTKSSKGLINNELLKELEVEFRPYRYISCSEAELEYLKNELAKIESDTNESDKIEIEKQIKQIEQELKETYIREDETDIERYTRYIKAVSLELKDSDDYLCRWSRFKEEEDYNWKLRQMQEFHQKRLEALKNQ